MIGRLKSMLTWRSFLNAWEQPEALEFFRSSPKLLRSWNPEIFWEGFDGWFQWCFNEGCLNTMCFNKNWMFPGLAISMFNKWVLCRAVDHLWKCRLDPVASDFRNRISIGSDGLELPMVRIWTVLWKPSAKELQQLWHQAGGLQVGNGPRSLPEWDFHGFSLLHFQLSSCPILLYQSCISSPWGLSRCSSAPDWDKQPEHEWLSACAGQP